MTSEFEPFLNWLKTRDAALKAKAREHEQVRSSKPYKHQLSRLGKTIRDFHGSLRLVLLATTRSADFHENCLMYFFLDDVAEAVLTSASAIESGALASARREMRYVLEVAVNAAYTDETGGREQLSEKLRIFKSKRVAKRNVDHINDLPLRLLGDERQAFRDAVRSAWVGSSNNVHPTKRRIDQKLELRSQGIDLGFETSAMLEDCVGELHFVCSATLILFFETIGPSFTGDVWVEGLAEQDTWIFHSNQFIAALDAHFDYKHERQAQLTHYIQRRAARLRACSE